MNARGNTSFSLERLQHTLADFDDAADPVAQLDLLVELGLDRIPLPGQGATLVRWQALAKVAQSDLSLAKLYEGHTDALAIRAEIGEPAAVMSRVVSEVVSEVVSDVVTDVVSDVLSDVLSDAFSEVDADTATPTWGVWAAEAPQGRVVVTQEPGGGLLLQGKKCWCSGAGSASHALLTAWRGDEREPQLMSVALRQPGVHVSHDNWHAIGMNGSASLDVTFDGARAEAIGQPGEYLNRPGFWQGGAGIAACWYGGALALAKALRASLASGAAASRSPFRRAALGRVDVALQSTASVLRASADWIDTNPMADARAVALRARLSAEHTAALVLDEVGRALGATPFCRDARFARMAADLPVFIRQSHAERDLAALGDAVLEEGPEPWQL